jgi:hypothetical protein
MTSGDSTEKPKRREPRLLLPKAGSDPMAERIAAARKRLSKA